MEILVCECFKKYFNIKSNEEVINRVINDFNTLKKIIYRYNKKHNLDCIISKKWLYIFMLILCKKNKLYILDNYYKKKNPKTIILELDKIKNSLQ